MNKIDNKNYSVIVQSSMFVDAEGLFGTVPEALLRAWASVSAKTMVRTDGRRIHVAYNPVDIESAFATAGIDPYEYGILAHDSWDAREAVTGEESRTVEMPDGTESERVETVVYETSQPAGEKRGIRYEEALALECAYQRWRLEQLEERVNQLTNNTNN